MAADARGGRGGGWRDARRRRNARRRLSRSVGPRRSDQHQPRIEGRRPVLERSPERRDPAGRRSARRCDPAGRRQAGRPRRDRWRGWSWRGWRAWRHWRTRRYWRSGRRRWSWRHRRSWQTRRAGRHRRTRSAGRPRRLAAAADRAASRLLGTRVPGSWLVVGLAHRGRVRHGALAGGGGGGLGLLCSAARVCLVRLLLQLRGRLVSAGLRRDRRDPMVIGRQVKYETPAPIGRL